MGRYRDDFTSFPAPLSHWTNVDQWRMVDAGMSHPGPDWIWPSAATGDAFALWDQAVIARKYTASVSTAIYGVGGGGVIAAAALDLSSYYCFAVRNLEWDSGAVWHVRLSLTKTVGGSTITLWETVVAYTWLTIYTDTLSLRIMRSPAETVLRLTYYLRRPAPLDWLPGELASIEIRDTSPLSGQYGGIFGRAYNSAIKGQLDWWELSWGGRHPVIRSEHNGVVHPSATWIFGEGVPILELDDARVQLDASGGATWQDLGDGMLWISGAGGCGSCQTSCQTACQLGCQTACELACQTTCQLACQAGCETGCQSTCETSCQTGCETNCQTACELACEGACQAACQIACESGCETGCEVACQAACQSACQGACESACQTACELGCQTACELACQSSCQSACQTACQLACQTGCQSSCQSACQTSCQTGCETNCQTACELACEGACQAACQIACESGCETGCEVACQAACQSACQGECESACQAACEAGCQMACEGVACEAACEAGCQTACEPACQTACQLACQAACQLACEGGCEAGCQTGCQLGCEMTCEAGCQTTCELACQTACQTACQDTCETACQQTCETACQQTCEAGCQAACEAACQTACQLDCEAACEAGCETFCQGACQTACELGCETACELACQTACELGCETACELACQTACELGCETACELACQTACELGCETACELACQTACELGCETACELACQTACELGCETACELACQSGCQGGCETACELACEGACEAACQTGAEAPPCDPSKWYCVIEDRYVKEGGFCNTFLVRIPMRPIWGGVMGPGFNVCLPETNYNYVYRWAGGPYETEEEATVICGRYSCVDGVCLPNPQGEYIGLAACEAACAPSFDPGKWYRVGTSWVSPDVCPESRPPWAAAPNGCCFIGSFLTDILAGGGYCLRQEWNETEQDWRIVTPAGYEALPSANWSTIMSPCFASNQATIVYGDMVCGPFDVEWPDCTSGLSYDDFTNDWHCVDIYECVDYEEWTPECVGGVCPPEFKSLMWSEPSRDATGCYSGGYEYRERRPGGPYMCVAAVPNCW